VGIMLITGSLVLDDGQNDTLGDTSQNDGSPSLAINALDTLEIKGRAPKTGYSRTQFGNGWASWQTCNVRDKILARDMTDVVYVDDGTCKVARGTLDDPYTGRVMQFVRGPSTSQEIHIDHVVALSDAWQKGAQDLSHERRVEFHNDDINLLAVEGRANQIKGDADAATWLPSNKPFRCQFVARQIAIKVEYELWVTQAERDAMANVLKACPTQRLPNN
jgi:hypothetical protein